MLSLELINSLQLKLYSVQRVKLGRWWDYEQVTSPFTRLYYVLSGSKTYVEHSGRRFDMKDGVMLVVPPFTVVDYKCGDSCDLFSVHFGAETRLGLQLFTLKDMGWVHEETGLLPGLFERLVELNPGKELKIANPAHRAYNQSIRSLLKEDVRIQCVIETDSILKLLFSRFICENVKKQRNISIVERRVTDVLKYIHVNIDKPLNLGRLAKQVHVNPTYLSNSFFEVLKVRPSTYITNKRIERAQLLLLSSDKGLKEIAVTVGFSNPDYFYRVFKKKLGLTPSEYRSYQFKSKR